MVRLFTAHVAKCTTSPLVRFAFEWRRYSDGWRIPEMDRLKKFLPYTTDFDGCLNCGSNDHSTRKCTAKPCAYCGLRFCFGARVRGPKPGCLAKKVVEGGEISTTDLGLNGRPLNVYLTGQIKDKAEVIKARAANATKEANAAVQTDPKIKNVIDPDDYANESDCCEMLFASQVCC